MEVSIMQTPLLNDAKSEQDAPCMDAITIPEEHINSEDNSDCFTVKPYDETNIDLTEDEENNVHPVIRFIKEMTLVILSIVAITAVVAILFMISGARNKENSSFTTSMNSMIRSTSNPIPPNEKNTYENSKISTFNSPITTGNLTYPNGKVKFEGDLLFGNTPFNGKYYSEEGYLKFEGSFFMTGKFSEGKVYDSKGNILFSGKFDELSERPISGKEYIYFDSGKLRFDLDLQGSSIKAKGKQYDEKGQLFYEGDFIDFEPYGYGKCYTNGILVAEGSVKDGNLNGNCKTYNPDGSLDSEGYYVNNRPDGFCKLYYPNGNLKFKGNFSNGQSEGEGSEYHENGVLYRTGEYKKGKFIGGQYY